MVDYGSRSGRGGRAMTHGDSMNVGTASWRAAAALALVASSSSVARAALTSCSSQSSFLDLADCADRNTGELIGRSRGVAVDGDQFLSLQAGDVGGFSNLEIVQSQIEVRDANGTLLEDCRFVNNDPRGVFMFGFGAGSSACDTGVAVETLIFYDDEVRL